MTRNRRLGYTLLAVLFSAGLSAETITAQTYDVLEFFNSAGLSPQTRLIQATDGNLYGTTPYSRANGYGTIFRIDTGGTTLTTLHSFAYTDGAYPYGGLIQGSDGNLYGTTLQGGASGKGTIFKIDTSGTTLTTLHSFNSIDGATPFAPLVQGSDGNLYGTASYGGSSNCNGGCGTIFKTDTSGSTFVTLHFFVNTDGSFPYAGLIQGTDGNLYGTAAVGSAGAVFGTIFKIDTNGASFTTLHEFLKADGATPYGGVTQGADGNLYGTTNIGGASDNGTIFRIQTNGGAFTTLHNFAYTDGAQPWAGLMQGTDGNLYGTTNQGGASGYGTILKINTAGTAFTTLHSFNLADGAYLYAGLIQAVDGRLYGTTNRGGAGGWGTIFKIDTAGSLTTVHSFLGSDGLYPYAGFVQGTDGNLYGTTRVGGTSGYGAVFKLDTNGTTLTTLHDFAGGDGGFPFATLIQGADGNLYGTTHAGGASNDGTIFKIDTGGSTFTTLHTFSGSDGSGPYARLIQATDGSLYGTTYTGGANNAGTIFRINTSGSMFATLHNFSGGDGANPWANLVQAADGNLYGTTYGGGPSGAGTVFRINTAGTNFTTLHSLHPSGDGAHPYGGLIQAADGNLYGTAAQGGNGCVPNGCGTVFKIDTGGATFATLHFFSNGEDGSGPQAGLIQGADGSLYGAAANGGTRGSGTIFKIDTNGAALTTLHTFTQTDGAASSAALIQAADGRLYGTTTGGGPAFGGVAFRLVLTGAAFQTTGVTPTSGPASGGTAVSITGLGFSSTDTVSFAGIAATGVALIGPTQIDAMTPALSPGTLNDVVVTKLDLSGAQLSRGFFSDFLDVPESDGFHAYVEKIFRAGITSGCGGGNYCRDDPVTRAQMAVFLLRAEHGSSYIPPPCRGIFADVPCTPVPAFAVNWIEQLSTEGITGGCGGGNYCPADPVTRAQMAVFLLRAEHGPGYSPPACTPPGMFADVPCPGGFAVNWIEQLHTDGVTAGCGSNPPIYCPNDASSRGQMAVFLSRAFGL